MKKSLIVVGLLLITFALVAVGMPAIQAQAQSATPTPVPFTAAPQVVSMYPAMGEINPDTGRPTGVTAPRGDDPTRTYAVFSPGTRNVPPGVPVYLSPGAIGLADGAKVKAGDFKLEKAPGGSTAKLEKVTKAVPGLTTDMVTFTPDKEGEYTLSLVVSDDKGAKSAPGQIVIAAARYVGSEVCKNCHKEQFEGWSKTLHGHAFADFVNQNAEGEYFSAGLGCARCHTVGYYPVTVSTGGWWELMGGKDAAKNWPKNDIALNAFNEEAGKDTFSTKFPANVQSLSNIGCEACHGPAGAHVVKPSKDTAPMPTTGSASCDQCHNAGGHHTRGVAVANSAHARASELGEGNRPECARCHSSAGFIDTLTGAKEVRAVNDDIGCATCHDPHGDANVFQLRTVGAVSIPETVSSDPAAKPQILEIKDAGLSAICMNCHNARRGADIVKDDKATRFTPHASTATEMIAGVGGFDWGYKLQNSYHVNLGKGVINDEHSNQPGNMGFTQVNMGQAPGACVLCHMYRTPGGVWDTKDSLTVPGHQTLGGHSFAMVTTGKDGKEIQHLEVCQQCHPGITTFDFKAGADYDGDGTIEGVETEVAGLKDALAKAIVAWKDPAGKQVTFKDGSFAYKDVTLSLDIKAAMYNYSFVNVAGPVHNLYRSVGLLQLSIEKVSGNPLPKATLLYSK